jgi:hypothetical protein
MILQNGLKPASQEPEYVKENPQDGRIYIRPRGFLEKYDTFIDEYKREPEGQDRHDDVQTFINNIETAQMPLNCDIKVRQIGARCLRVILHSFLLSRRDMPRRRRRSLALGVDNSVMQLDSSNSSNSNSNSQRNPFDVGENGARAQPDNRSNNLSRFFDANSNSQGDTFGFSNSDDSDENGERSNNSKSPATRPAFASATPPAFASATPPAFASSYHSPPPTTTTTAFDSQNPYGVSITDMESNDMESTDIESETRSLLGNKPAAATTTVTKPYQSFFSRILGSEIGGKRRTMKAKKYLKNNRKKTIKKNKKTIKKPIRKNKKTIKKPIRKNKKTRKTKS